MSLISLELMHDTAAGGHARPVPVFQSAHLATLQLPGTGFSTEVLVLCCRLSTDVDRFIVRRAVKADITGMCKVADACAASWSAQQLKVSSPLECKLLTQDSGTPTTTNCHTALWRLQCTEADAAPGLHSASIPYATNMNDVLVKLWMLLRTGSINCAAHYFNAMGSMSWAFCCFVCRL